MAEVTDNYSAEQETAQQMAAEQNQARLLAQQQAQAAQQAEQRMAALKAGKGKADGATKAMAKAISALLKVALKWETSWFFALGIAYINIHLLMSKVMPKVFVPLGREEDEKLSKLPEGMRKMEQKMLALKDNLIHYAETGCCCLLIIISLAFTAALVAAFDSTIGKVINWFSF